MTTLKLKEIASDLVSNYLTMIEESQNSEEYTKGALDCLKMVLAHLEKVEIFEIKRYYGNFRF